MWKTTNNACCYVWDPVGIFRFKGWKEAVISELIQGDLSHFTFLSSLKWLPLSLLCISTAFNHSFSFLVFYYFCFTLPPPRALFLYFSALTGNGFACHVTLVTGCVMDGILVRTLLCLRHTAGQRHPATSHSTCHAPHPAHVTLYY